MTVHVPNTTVATGASVSGRGKGPVQSQRERTTADSDTESHSSGTFESFSDESEESDSSETPKQMQRRTHISQQIRATRPSEAGRRNRSVHGSAVEVPDHGGGRGVTKTSDSASRRTTPISTRSTTNSSTTLPKSKSSTIISPKSPFESDAETGSDVSDSEVEQVAKDEDDDEEDSSSGSSDDSTDSDTDTEIAGRASAGFAAAATKSSASAATVEAAVAAAAAAAPSTAAATKTSPPHFNHSIVDPDFHARTSASSSFPLPGPDSSSQTSPLHDHALHAPNTSESYSNSISIDHAQSQHPQSPTRPACAAAATLAAPSIATFPPSTARIGCPSPAAAAASTSIASSVSSSASSVASIAVRPGQGPDHFAAATASDTARLTANAATIANRVDSPAAILDRHAFRERPSSSFPSPSLTVAGISPSSSTAAHTAEPYHHGLSIDNPDVHSLALSFSPLHTDSTTDPVDHDTRFLHRVETTASACTTTSASAAEDYGNINYSSSSATLPSLHSTSSHSLSTEPPQTPPRDNQPLVLLQFTTKSFQPKKKQTPACAPRPNTLNQNFSKPTGAIRVAQPLPPSTRDIAARSGFSSLTSLAKERTSSLLSRKFGRTLSNAQGVPIASTVGVYHKPIPVHSVSLEIFIFACLSRSQGIFF
jgi:hypothetical protein